MFAATTNCRSKSLRSAGERNLVGEKKRRVSLSTLRE